MPARIGAGDRSGYSFQRLLHGLFEVSPMRFVNWEWRPAVTDSVRAFAVLAPGEDWTEVDSAEVSESGWIVPEDEFRSIFADAFGTLPPLPDAMLAQAGPALANAAE
jgi:hypothetical protein